MPFSIAYKSSTQILIIGALCGATLAGPTHVEAIYRESISLTGKHSVSSQNQDSSVEVAIRKLEQHVEEAIASGDATFLQSVYSDDFRFMHFDGETTNKAESLKQVAQRPYLTRRLDALNIELHGDIAVTEGLVDISARSDHGNHSYLVKYIRVYEHKNGHWEMLMQRSVGETSPIAFDVSSSK